MHPRTCHCHDNTHDVLYNGANDVEEVHVITMHNRGCEEGHKTQDQKCNEGKKF
jgi:hypothetical protein